MEDANILRKKCFPRSTDRSSTMRAEDILNIASSIESTTEAFFPMGTLLNEYVV